MLYSSLNKKINIFQHDGKGTSTFLQIYIRTQKHFCTSSTKDQLNGTDINQMEESNNKNEEKRTDSERRWVQGLKNARKSKVRRRFSKVLQNFLPMLYMFHQKNFFYTATRFATISYGDFRSKHGKITYYKEGTRTGTFWGFIEEWLVIIK